jgi:hypothetical protein
MSFNSPIETFDGYLIKRDDMFSLGEIIKGGKVRQCLKIVYENLDEIKSKYNGGLITGCGLPSPQSTIVSAVSKYFGLKCIVVSPIYDNSKVDVNRINVSLSQKLGAKIYGVGNPNPSGYKLDVKKLKDELGYYEIKFGMNSESVIDTTSHQVKNIPNELENLVVICGSGLNLLGILKGIVKYKKKVNNVYGITLSKFFDENKKLYYDNLVDKEKYKGQLHIIRSPYPYQRLKKTDIPFLDWTYESKAYSFMTENISPSTNTLFWVVGIRNYDLDNIVPIKWNKSKHEKKLDKERVKRKVVLKKSNIHNLKTNLTYHEIQSLSFTDLSNWVDDLRNEILYNWDVKNEPPVIGKSKEQIIKSFSKLRDYPIEDLFIEDENYPHHLGFIKNFTKTPINQFFPSMYKVRIDRKPSIYDFFHEEDLQQRFKRHIVRNVRMDGMYLYTKYLTNTNGQLDTDYFQKWKSGLNGNTGFYLERTDQVNNNGTTHKVYLPTKSVKKLQGQGILDDGDLRNNVDFGDDDEPSGYTVRYYDKNEKIIPKILQVFRIGLGTQPAVNFPTLSARLLYEKYLPKDQDNHIVWDCCSGYGGRLLGSLSSKLKIHYVGTEVNSSIWKNYDELGNFYNENCGGKNTWEIFKVGSEVVHKNKSFQKIKGKLDMVFTSTPYFSRELYSYDKGQSFIKFPNYRDWLNGFLGPTIKTSYEYLKPNRYLILNIADIKMGENNFIPLEQDTIELAVKIGFSYIGRMDMTMGKMIGVKQSSVKNKYFSMDSKKTYKTEPILCFLKK